MQAETPPNRIAGQAVEVFHLAQKTLAEKDIETFWSLLDCDSQSQADHFADQAQQRASNPKHTTTILKKLSISKDELNKLDKSQKYFVYCRSGNRTGQSMRQFESLGFKDIVHLQRGIVDWLGSGYKMIK